MPTREEFNEIYGTDPDPTQVRKGTPRSFEGFSEFNDESDAESISRAVKAAALAADLDRGEGKDPEWFEVTRLRVLVGNPHVKVWGATITSTHSP